MSATWRRFVAGFILIWALLDLSIPGVCQSDDLESTPVSAQEMKSAQQAASSTVQDYSAIPDGNPSDQSGPEDCFCCCSHVTPTSTFSMPGPILNERYSSPDLTLSPLEYSPILYHPPHA
jgi:hypothetical protein